MSDPVFIHEKALVECDKIGAECQDPAIVKQLVSQLPRSSVMIQCKQASEARRFDLFGNDTTKVLEVKA